MADPKHLALLNRGKIVWNSWRKKNPDILPYLNSANLANADLRGLNLRQAQLNHSDLQSADLRGIIRKGRAHPSFGWAADLRGANLQGAILFGADLRGGRLRDANLAKANLARANLQDAVMRDAELQDANLYEANLKGVYLKDTHGLTQDQIDGAIGDETTKLPAHLRRPDTWKAKHPPSATPQPTGLTTPVNLSWHGGRISAAPGGLEETGATPSYQEGLTQAQLKLSEDLLDAIRYSNIDQSLFDALDKYLRELRNDIDNFNVILLQSYYRILRHLFFQNRDAASDFAQAGFVELFNNHNILIKAYPSLLVFLEASAKSDIHPPAEIRNKLAELPVILSDPPAPEIIDPEVVQIVSAEAAEPDYLPTESPDIPSDNHAKWYGLAAIAGRVYTLLASAPALEAGLKAVASLMQRLKSLWVWIQQFY